MRLLSSTQTELLRVAEILRGLSTTEEEKTLLDTFTKEVELWRSEPNPPQLRQRLAFGHPRTGWWRAAMKLASALREDDGRAQVDIRTALRIAESLQASRQGPKLVFHYTSMAGLKGILESGRLRATHFEYLNDPDEVHYCRGLFGEHARSADPTAPDPLFFGEEYIASFSELPDDLPQWRTYADGGAGVSVGFVRGSKFTLPPHWDARWVRVEYAEQKHRKMVRGATVADVLELAPTMKRATHAFEREWRLVAHTGAFLDACPPVVLSPSKFGLTPSIDLVPEGGLLPIQQIVLGPKAGPKAWYSVALLVRSRGYSLVEFNEPREAGVFMQASTCRAQ